MFYAFVDCLIFPLHLHMQQIFQLELMPKLMSFPLNFELISSKPQIGNTQTDRQHCYIFHTTLSP